MRCLTLADELARVGAETLFLCREFEGNLIARVRDHGHQVLALPPGDPSSLPEPGATAHAGWLHATRREDSEAAEAALDGAAVPRLDWLVVDHYALDAAWETRLRSRAAHILAIDDLADRIHDCDALLDQNLRTDAGAGYAGLVPPGSRLLLGPSHALLRPEFAAGRSGQAERPDRVASILVFLGGSDPEDHTGRCLEALACLEDVSAPGPDWNVVIGPSNPHAGSLGRRWAARPGTIFHRDARDMAGLIAGAGLALAGGGISTWERSCLGLPTVALSIAFNQEALLESAARHGLLAYAGRARDLSSGEIARHVSSLLGDPERRRAMSRKGMEIVDGLGCGRVAEALSAIAGKM
jgi:UDP-2,4-diacetamido-2,4,6-trideoxy-beta-L-altropyranose hydrolase